MKALRRLETVRMFSSHLDKDISQSYDFLKKESAKAKRLLEYGWDGSSQAKTCLGEIVSRLKSMQEEILELQHSPKGER